MLGPVFAALALFIIDAERFFGIRDGILKQIYEENRALWHELGRPSGRLWRPQGEKSYVGAYYNQELWRRGSKIEQFSPAKPKYEQMRRLGRRILAADIPILLTVMFLWAFISSHHLHN